METPESLDEKSPIHPPPEAPPAAGVQLITAPPPMYTEMPPASQLIQQPGLNGSGQWSAGLCDCFSEFRLFCLSFWCPCITFGQVSEIIDRGTSSCEVNCRIHFAILCITGWACIYSSLYRTKMREQYNLEGSPIEDLCIHCLCEPCSLTQMHRELQHRGLDVALGWQENLKRRGGVSAMPSSQSQTPPVVEVGMKH
ncbi:hypothetical protein SAY87_013230 [Trapa incisa]|uniref:Uncharacterized protein n=1 Tax=Trapa incisa TaxID=236973 RepID=A0AAN7KHT1_9MYRT|nr:hypothetical protein SAY87_013230 [Trapa incisa]